jgi:hypothetical protein
MQLKLDSGRIVHLGEFRQWRVYEWVWEGLPTKEMNRRTVERIVAENRGHYGEPFLVVPEEKPLEYREGKRYPFGEPAALPGVCCVGRFRSHWARDKEKDYSRLVVIWFQEEFAFPIDAKVMALMQSLDWEKLASDHEY